MKKLLLISFFFTSIAIQAQYKSMLVDSSYWNVYNVTIGLGFSGSYTDSMYLGDTISIKGRHYHEIRGDEYAIYTGDSIYGYIREDTTLGKAWFLKEDTSTTENLIYDLTLLKGDTFKVVDGPIGVIEFKVDTTYFKNTRKYIKLTTISNQSYQMYVHAPNIFSPFTFDSLLLIEGVGSIRGFDNRMNTGFGSVGSSERLLCAHQNDSQVFRHGLDSIISVFNGCYYDFITGNITNEEISSSTISLYPNPSKEYVSLNTTKSINQILIFDALGKKVNASYSMKGTEYKVDLNLLGKGLCIIQILFTDGTAVNSKIIKE